MSESNFLAAFPLHYACATADLHAIENLLGALPPQERLKALRHKFHNDNTPMHVLFHFLGREMQWYGKRVNVFIACLQRLMAYGAPAHALNSQGRRPVELLNGAMCPALFRLLAQEQQDEAALLAAEAASAQHRSVRGKPHRQRIHRPAQKRKYEQRRRSQCGGAG